MTSHPRKHYYYTSNHLRRRINIDYAAAALERCSVLAIRRLCGYCGYRGAAAYSHTWDKDYICASASHWRGKHGDQRRVKPSLREHYNFVGRKTPSSTPIARVGMPRDTTIGALSATRGSGRRKFSAQIIESQKSTTLIDISYRAMFLSDVFNIRKHDVCGSLITSRPTRWSEERETVIDRRDGPACRALFIKWQRSRRTINFLSEHISERLAKWKNMTQCVQAY